MEDREFKPRRRSILPLALQEARDLVGDVNGGFVVLLLVIISTLTWVQQHHILYSISLVVASVAIGFYARQRTLYIRTQEGYRVERGIFRHQRTEIRLKDLVITDISRNHVSLLLGLYNLDLYTAGDSSPAVTLKHLSWADVERLAVDPERLRQRTATGDIQESSRETVSTTDYRLSVSDSLRSALLAGPMGAIPVGIATIMPLILFHGQIGNRPKRTINPEELWESFSNLGTSLKPPPNEVVEIGTLTLSVPGFVYAIGLFLLMFAAAFLVGVVMLAILNIRAGYQSSGSEIAFSRLFRLKAWSLENDRIYAVRVSAGLLSRRLGGHRVELLTLGQSSQGLECFTIPFLPTHEAMHLLSALGLGGPPPEDIDRIHYRRTLVHDLGLQVILPLVLATILAYPVTAWVGAPHIDMIDWFLPALALWAPILWSRRIINAARVSSLGENIQFGEHRFMNYIVYSKTARVHGITHQRLGSLDIAAEVFIPGCRLRLAQDGNPASPASLTLQQFQGQQPGNLLDRGETQVQDNGVGQ